MGEKMKVILTGGGGFIGSHCLEYFLKKTDWRIFVIDSFKHKGTFSRINEIAYDGRVKIFHHDLTVPIDKQLENQLLEVDLFGNSIPVDYIFNLASDSAVERSITNPGACWFNNCALIYNMLELARAIKPKLFVNIGTDEVYGEANDRPHKEWDSIVPSNPYSASKAAQEALSISYFRTYDVPIILVSPMNAIGEWQDKEKFLPKLIWKIATGQKMEIYGEPGKIGSRFYIHAKNIADALIFLSKKKPAMYSDGAQKPDRYNIVGDMEMNNLEVAEFVAKVMKKTLNYEFVPCEVARRGYDRRYALDGSRLASMGWKHPISTLQAIEQIVKWSLDHSYWII